MDCLKDYDDEELVVFYKNKIRDDNLVREEHYEIKEQVIEDLTRMMKDEITSSGGCDDDREVLRTTMRFLKYNFDEHWIGVLVDVYNLDLQKFYYMAPSEGEFLDVCKELLGIAAIQFYKEKVNQDSKYFVDCKQLKQYLESKSLI
jgi:hypothetical protein